MSFHDVRLDTTISHGAVGGPTYATAIQTTASGHEYRITRQAAGRRRYEFSKDLLDANGTGGWASLLEFAAARRGNLHGFRLKDWSDFTTATDGRSAPSEVDQVIGTGDGAQTQFQLLKTYDASGPNPEVRPITLPVAGTVLVAKDGTPTSSYTLTNPGGVITFASAPADGVIVTAGCEFDVPVRFDLPQEWVRIELIEGLLANWSRIGCIELLNEVETPELWYPGGSSGTIELSSDYTVHFGVELWTFAPSSAVNIFLPAPDRLPGGPNILTIHNLAGSASTLQILDDAGGSVGSTFSAGTTRRVMLSRSGSSAAWVLA